MGGIRVLLVDDHALLREGIGRLLRAEPDIEVVGEAGNGLEAVAMARSLSPDVVLMDVVMPRLNGVEATKAIKRDLPGVAVIILTAYEDDRYIIGLLEAGAAGYLLKLSCGREVVQAIRAVCAGEAVMHPAITARLLALAVPSVTRPAAPAIREMLTGRELGVLRLAAAGLANKEIAARLSLSVATVKVHLVNMFNKMGVASRTEAVVEAVRRGWMDIEECRQAEAEEVYRSGPYGI